MNVENWKFMIETLKKAKEKEEPYTNCTWTNCAFGKYLKAKGLRGVTSTDLSINQLMKREFDVDYWAPGPNSVFSHTAKTIDIAIENAEKHLKLYLQDHPESVKETPFMSITVKQLPPKMKECGNLNRHQCFRYNNKLYVKTGTGTYFCFNDLSIIGLCPETLVELTKVEVIEIP